MISPNFRLFQHYHILQFQERIEDNILWKIKDFSNFIRQTLHSTVHKVSPFMQIAQSCRHIKTVVQHPTKTLPFWALASPWSRNTKPLSPSKYSDTLCLALRRGKLWFFLYLFLHCLLPILGLKKNFQQTDDRTY